MLGIRHSEISPKNSRVARWVATQRRMPHEHIRPTRSRSTDRARIVRIRIICCEVVTKRSWSSDTAYVSCSTQSPSLIFVRPSVRPSVRSFVRSFVRLLIHVIHPFSWPSCPFDSMAYACRIREGRITKPQDGTQMALPFSCFIPSYFAPFFNATSGLGLLFIGIAAPLLAFPRRGSGGGGEFES